ncbi:hypothetical protein PHLGIDRAFT_122426 [Phlebiopsis gigantea 11061_1 CR5-6]|uniref:Uncharacterized protein n=1 Tax=Phlebiopsis gigantea (strain 11061_1 CR5-6) TaxID=745531 RepID=A0A0C3ND86_PHLG1|nr:hypothetical protein PHLGIDRAFT_122426 [Phlebiopsis gigantea 11061_1 CR5-6]
MPSLAFRTFAMDDGELGSHQGTKHTSPDLQRDIERHMQSLRDRDVYTIEDGRVVDLSDDGEDRDATQYGAVLLPEAPGALPRATFGGTALL